MYPPSEKQFPTAGENSSNVHGAVFNLPEAGVIDLTPFSQENVEKHVVNTVVLERVTVVQEGTVLRTLESAIYKYGSGEVKDGLTNT